MPKIYLTEDLATTIKTIRVANKISSKSLATHIGKSPSFITKLEKAELKTVEREELDQIFDFIIHDQPSFKDKVNEIISTASFKFSSEELEAQLWYSNYTTVFCKVPLPEELVDDISRKMLKHEITIEYLHSRINANEALLPETVKNSRYPRNEWFFENGRQGKSQSIIIDITFDRLQELLTKRVTTTRYIYMLAISYYIFKIIRFGTVVQISDECSTELMREAKEYLASYRFYSLDEKHNRIHDALEDDTKASYLCAQDKQFISEQKKLLDVIRYLSEIDVEQVNRQLGSFNKVIEWDLGFAFHLLELPFYKIGNASYTYKQELFQEIEALIQKYEEIPQEQKSVEKYH